MRTPKNARARELAPAVARALLAGLAARGFIAPGDELAVLIAARDSCQRDHPLKARNGEAWLDEAIAAYRQPADEALRRLN